MTGMPLTRMVFEEVKDPASGEPKTDENGNIILAPIPTLDSDITFTEAEIELDTVSFDDDANQNQVLLEQFMNGPTGNLLSQVNPAGYFKAGALAVKNTKTKYSLELSSILEQTAQMLNPQQQQAMQQGQLSGQMSQEQSQNNMPGRAMVGGE